MIIAIGSNIGDRLKNCIAAIDNLRIYFNINKISSIYETPPMGFKDQSLFYNLVVQISSQYWRPIDVLHVLKSIEKRIGRKTTFKNGPRLIDLDVIFLDDMCLSLDKLKIPHPHCHERLFVLQPLADICPNHQHPILKKNIQTLLKDLESKSQSTLKGKEIQYEHSFN